MKNVTATIYLPRYLEQYLRHHYGSPVRFPARSMENELLRRLTVRPPRSMESEAAAGGEQPRGIDPVEIVLPDDALHRPEYYNYLGRTARRRMVSAIDALFRVHLWTECLPLVVEGRINQGLDEWCRDNGIDLDAREAVRQKFYRMRCLYAPLGIKIGKKYGKSLP